MTNESQRRYVYLHLDYEDWAEEDSTEKEQSGITVHVKLEDEGVVVDVWSGDDKCIASTWKTYDEMGIEAVRDLNRTIAPTRKK